MFRWSSALDLEYHLLCVLLLCDHRVITLPPRPLHFDRPPRNH